MRVPAIRTELSLLILAIVLATSAATMAQQNPASANQAAPIPAQIVSAKKVFVSNAGADLTSEQYFKKDGDPNLAYDHFYAALRNSSRFTLVPAPADANLVLQIRFESPIIGFGSTASYAPQFQLQVFDAKTHFLLWTMVSPVEGAWRKATFEKNFATGLVNLMNDLTDVAGPPPQGAD
jgi:hypothetical protein